MMYQEVYRIWVFPGPACLTSPRPHQAIALRNSLVKEHKPRYNLKHDITQNDRDLEPTQNICLMGVGTSWGKGQARQAT